MHHPAFYGKSLSMLSTSQKSQKSPTLDSRRRKKHLPLGKNTGDPLEDLKLVFPTMFNGKVGLFEGETSLKWSPDAKPVQLSPRAMPQSILPKLRNELEKMEKEGIIRPCAETTDWVHNLVTVV